MTTIAYRDGVIAADSQLGDGGWISSGHINKLRRMNDGSVTAITGEVCKGLVLVEWLNGDRSSQRPDIGNETRVVHLTGDGLDVYEANGVFRLMGEFVAFGSGSPPAIAAMHMGADAVKAVQVAALVDPHTGGPVTTMTLGGA